MLVLSIIFINTTRSPLILAHILTANKIVADYNLQPFIHCVPKYDEMYNALQSKIFTV